MLYLDRLILKFLNMSLQTNTILYLNLVCEMIYVVAERLKTQNIPNDKSKLGSLLWSIINYYFIDLQNQYQ